MKCSLYISVLLLIVCSMNACKKNTYVNEGTVIKRYKITFNDTTVHYQIYDRDVNNRVVAIRDSAKTGENKTTLEYASDGKLSKVHFTYAGTTLLSYEFTYNTDGRIARRKIRAGSVPVGEDYNTYAYDMSGRLIADSSYGTVNNVTFKLTGVSKFQYDGSNIIFAERYSHLSGAAVLEERLKYNLDTEVNPFSSLPYEYYIKENGSAIYDIILLSANNATGQFKEVTSGNFESQVLYAHAYNSSNVAWITNAMNTHPPKITSRTEFFFQ